MIEPLLEAERAMDMGLLDQAERLFRGVAESDPRNSIAVVGLSRVALERGEDAKALILARRAAQIDPENPMAARMVARLEEVLAARGRSAGGRDTAPATPAQAPRTAIPVAEAAEAEARPAAKAVAGAAAPVPAAKAVAGASQPAATPTSPSAETATSPTTAPIAEPHPPAESAPGSGSEVEPAVPRTDARPSQPTSTTHRSRQRSLVDRLLRRH